MYWKKMLIGIKITVCIFIYFDVFQTMPITNVSKLVIDDKYFSPYTSLQTEISKIGIGIRT